jgi:hypothetical protein
MNDVLFPLLADLYGMRYRKPTCPAATKRARRAKNRIARRTRRRSA